MNLSLYKYLAYDDGAKALSVTMLPPGDVSISAISFIFRCIPSVGESVSKWLSEKFVRYMYAGNMRHLSIFLHIQN